MKMKNKMNALVIGSILAGVLPQASQAGVILIAGSGGAAMPIVGGAAAGIAGTFSVVGAAAPDVFGMDINSGTQTLMIVLGSIGVVLDVDASKSQQQIEQLFATKYSFIENQQVFKYLANQIKVKANAIEFVNGKKEVKLSREEVLNSLKVIDCRGFESQVEQMIVDLG